MNEPLCCGSCDATPCDPFSEKCCNGTCTNVCTGSPCGDCNRPLQADEDCCNCIPRKRGSPQNCAGDCRPCPSGRTCVNGSCQCPAGTRDCGDGYCCPNARECCNGTCCPSGMGMKCCNNKCVNTYNDVNNCGGCGQKCPQGGYCAFVSPIDKGQCFCPSNRIVCGTTPPGYCTDNMTLPSGPGSTQGWITWRNAHSTAPIFTCPNGVFTCNTQTGIVQLTDPADGLSVCCPPGSTKIVNGLCSV